MVTCQHCKPSAPGEAILETGQAQIVEIAWGLLGAAAGAAMGAPHPIAPGPSNMRIVGGALLFFAGDIPVARINPEAIESFAASLTAALAELEPSPKKVLQ